ncbi:DUF1998 domain-containing protein [Bradyrhizobium diazoefficiens]|uniref:DUF1998 domain-containing protein n=1 Tax=Bradyrhizobium diazoefficiens TaxID=1355477 RepID=UPI00272C6F6E|nr:DUF1998 domain-containing protein [Bradyrhizobium diazoefficiens]WLA74070.1 DUF1998 domain-containing protein [Bradyrhizobium diazoefficiens]
MSKPSIRSGQLIAPFGVGSLCEVDGQSFFVRGTGRWNKGRNLEDLELRALTSRLRTGVTLKRPVFSVAVSRFPRWHFCPACRAMVFWDAQRDQVAQPSDPIPKPTCGDPKCRRQRLVPMRFVATCDGGHLDEIDWYFWAHRRSQRAQNGSCDRRTAQLSFLVTGQSGGDFSSMEISCNCGARSSLEGISEGPLPQRCTGRQPNEAPLGCIDPSDPQRRAYPLHMEPRGSSALHYASIISALDISVDPTQSDAITALKADSTFKSLLGVAINLGRADNAIFGGQITALGEAHGVSAELAWQAFDAEVSRQQSNDAGGLGAEDIRQSDILGDEFPVLADDIGITSRTLVTRPSRLGARYQLGTLLEKVVQVERLREVRAFRGFQRRKPTEENPMISPSLGQPAPIWLPAIEVIGEGIFVEFSRRGLGAWLDNNKEAIAAFTAPQLQSAETLGLPRRFGFEANPVFVMVHTFAHLLINQLSFDCGYSSTSLRERIYCGPTSDLYAGLLIYTADSDSEGSMGGLVELGSAGRFAEVAYRAVSRSEWCSGDPVCRELEAQGIDGLNRAACHACSLVAETSCTFSNVLLDRVLISGNGQLNGRNVREPVGYFRPMLEP